jgi:adhesin transport system outer membrane protein
MRSHVNKATFQYGLTAIALAALALNAQAQTAPSSGLSGAAQKAIDSNPEVTARLNALRAASNEISVARGGYLPRVDLSASVGRDSDRITNRNPESQNLYRNGVALSANQVLWDGLSTRKEVERLGHAKATRYFEFLAATEDAALEASRAYLDVQRYRKLVGLAQDNYVQHKYVHDQLQSKVKAGVGRGVDSEQANARLALAESNLTTEVANLHDVSARYLRIVGEAPAANLPAAQGLEKGLSTSNQETTNQALASSATIEAAVENLRAAKAQATRQDSTYQPKVEARVRSGLGKNFDGVESQKRDTAAEILMTWNLYNGGSDRARARQLADQVNQAADQRDKACRDVRQTAAIAHNDIQKLKDQIRALDHNVLAIEKARDAYRQQFDIGQRSLLDLLNSENELYTAKRAYANAESDLQLAYARTHAAKNSLTANLGLAQSKDTAGEQGKDWQAAEEAAQRCPVVGLDVGNVSLDELDKRAKSLSGPAASAVPTPAPLPASAPVAVQTVTERLRAWVAAWTSKDIDRYMGFYAKDFAPARSTSAKWINERRRLVGKPGPIDVQLGEVQVEAKGDAVVTSFIQNYHSQNFRDSTPKVLTWKQIAGQWVIVKESNR